VTPDRSTGVAHDGRGSSSVRGRNRRRCSHDPASREPTAGATAGEMVVKDPGGERRPNEALPDDVESTPVRPTDDSESRGRSWEDRQGSLLTVEFIPPRGWGLRIGDEAKTPRCGSMGCREPTRGASSGYGYSTRVDESRARI
jgi:hypothetical protein